MPKMFLKIQESETKKSYTANNSTTTFQKYMVKKDCNK